MVYGDALKLGRTKVEPIAQEHGRMAAWQDRLLKECYSLQTIYGAAVPPSIFRDKSKHVSDRMNGTHEDTRLLHQGEPDHPTRVRPRYSGLGDG